MKIAIVLTLMIPFLGYAAERPPLHDSLSDLLTEIRDPVFSTAQRRSILEFARGSMRAQLARELGARPSELNLEFMKNPLRASHLVKDPWVDVQTQFYTTLHQETFSLRWQGLQRLVKFSPYGKSITATIQGHWATYSPTQEGRFYIRWNKMSVKQSSRNFAFKLPYFLLSDQIDELLSTEAHAPVNELLGAPEYATFEVKAAGLSAEKKQELAEKMILVRETYKRAIAGAAKTLASVYFLTGIGDEKLTTAKVANFLDTCPLCSTGEKRDILKAALIYVKNIRPTMPPQTPETLTRNFCSSLRKNNYYWNVDKLKPTPAEILLGNTLALARYYTIHKLKEKNHQAIARTILEQNFGILFLTSAINVLDSSQEVVGTRLACLPSTLSQDTGHILAAVSEAEQNIRTYAQRITNEVTKSAYKLEASTRAVEYFVQTNQAAVAEAMSYFPQGIGWTLKAIAELDQDIGRRRKMDKIITWGGTIIGIGLTLSGIGAPEGVAILVATAGVVKGVATGTYFLVRSGQEKQFNREMRLAQKGSAVLSEENLQTHYRDFKKLKLSYIKEYSGTALSFASLYKIAMKRTGDLKKAHDLVKGAMEGAKEIGKDQALDKIHELVVEATVSL